MLMSVAWFVQAGLPCPDYPNYNLLLLRSELGRYGSVLGWQICGFGRVLRLVESYERLRL